MGVFRRTRRDDDDDEDTFVARYEQVDHDEDEDGVIPGRQPGFWVTLAVISGISSVLMIIIAGLVLARAELSAAAIIEGGRPLRMWGLVLIMASGALLALVPLLLDHRYPARRSASPARMLLTGGVPFIMCAVTVPAFVGFTWAAPIADWPIGAALVGSAGLVVAGASAFGLGFGLVSSIRVQVPIEVILAQYETMRTQDPYKLDLFARDEDDDA